MLPACHWMCYKKHLPRDIVWHFCSVAKLSSHVMSIMKCPRLMQWYAVILNILITNCDGLPPRCYTVEISKHSRLDYTVGTSKFSLKRMCKSCGQIWHVLHANKFLPDSIEIGHAVDVLKMFVWGSELCDVNCFIVLKVTVVGLFPTSTYYHAIKTTR